VKFGLILGGGGEVGVAWEIGVLTGIQRRLGLQAEDFEVIVGTSAGAIVGALFALGRELEELVDLVRRGHGPVSPVKATFDTLSSSQGTSIIPTKLLEAMTSRVGTVQERARRVGRLALDAAVQISPDAFVAYVSSFLGSEWPTCDFRPTSVNANTGETVLWTRADGIGLATAVASSCAVPGFYPPVPFAGQHYIDTQRSPFSERLVEEKRLDAVLLVGLVAPTLTNTDEAEVLKALAESGRISAVTVMGGPRAQDVTTELMDPAARKLAVEIGLEDGLRSADELGQLMKNRQDGSTRKKPSN